MMDVTKITLDKDVAKLMGRVKNAGVKTLTLFREAIGMQMDKLNSAWKTTTAKQQAKTVDLIFDRAREIIVDKHDGGQAEDGITMLHFNALVTAIKNSLIFDVPVSITKDTPHNQLAKARKIVEDLPEDDDRPREEKFEQAVAEVKVVDEEKKVAAAQRREEAKAAATEPDPDLVELIDAWPTLPEQVRTDIMEMARGVAVA